MRRRRVIERLAGRWQVGADEAAPAGAGDTDYPLPHGGRERWYSVHRPPDAGPTDALPVVFNFHGGLGNPEQQRHDAGLDALADRERFIVVYPAGCGRLPRRWLTFNAGICCGYARMEGIDDVGFAEAVLEDVMRRQAIDADRIYGTGFSNGAFMCYRLAFERPDFFAAIAPVSGVLGIDPLPGVELPPIPVIHFHGEQDQFVAYAGGVGPLARDPQPRRSVEETLALMRRRNWCPDQPAREERIGRAVGRFYKPAPGGAPVVCWTLEDGGHTWPGGRSLLPPGVVGAVNADLDASTLIWEFLNKCRLSTRGG